MAKSNPRDPRYRSFRIGVLSVYLLVACAFSSAVIFSTFKSVLDMTPPRPAHTEEVLSTRQCADEARRLWLVLDDHRKGLTASAPAREADEEWSRFRVQWLRELRGLQARCGGQGEDREVLNSIFDRLEKIQDLYMTHAVQYAGEIGPAVDKLQVDFQRLR